MSSNNNNNNKSAPKKKAIAMFGSLPETMDDAARVTTVSGSTTARSVGAVAPPSGASSFGGIGGIGFGPTQTSSLQVGPTSSMSPMMMGRFGGGGGGGYSPKLPPGGGRVTTSAPKNLHKTPPPTTTAATTSSVVGWNINDETLPTLPDFHPLERTAVFIPHSHASTVAQRVSDCLRDESVAATYDDTKAKAKCFTSDNVEFRVRLYRGKRQYNHGVIVEVQRRFGFSVGFHAVVNAILDAAEGKKKQTMMMSEGVMTTAAPTTSMTFIPVVSDAEDDDDDEEEEEDEEFDAPPMTTLESTASTGKRKSCSSISIANDMLKKSRTVDANVMAMQSLASLTDPARMGNRAALRVSLELLSSSGENGGVLDAVVSLLLNGRLNDFDSSFSTPSTASSPSPSGGEDGPVSSLRLMAMTILCNAICTVSRSSSSSPSSTENSREVILSHHDLLLEDIVPILIKEIRNAKNDPRMASFATKCFMELIKVFGQENNDLVDAATELDVMTVLNSAQVVGQRNYVELADVCGRCIALLESR